MTLASTIQELEHASLAGMHIEDQILPKRCGHLDGKTVVDAATKTQRIAAAADARIDENFLIMARTDLRGTDGLDAAVDRNTAMVDDAPDANIADGIKDL